MARDRSRCLAYLLPQQETTSEVAIDTDSSRQPEATLCIEYKTNVLQEVVFVQVMITFLPLYL